MHEETVKNIILIAIDNNNDIIILATNIINYNEQKLIWNKQKYYVKNLKIELIIKEIKNFINSNKKSFIKLQIFDNKNTLESIFINLPWEIINKNELKEYI
jgi:hypothetical protein